MGMREDLEPKLLSATFEQIAVSLDSAVRDALETVVNREEKRPPAGRAVGKRNSQAAADIHGHRADERARRIQRQPRNICVELLSVIALLEEISLYVGHIEDVDHCMMIF